MQRRVVTCISAGKYGRLPCSPLFGGSVSAAAGHRGGSGMELHESDARDQRDVRLHQRLHNDKSGG